MSRVFAGARVLMAAAKKASASAAAAPATCAINRPLPVSPAMRRFLGVSEISRSSAVKKVWDHIKTNNLQDAANKRIICCDDKLKTIFDGKDTVGFTDIAKLLSNHFVNP